MLATSFLHTNGTRHLSIQPSYGGKFCHCPQASIIILCLFFFPPFSKSLISILTVLIDGNKPYLHWCPVLKNPAGFSLIEGFES